MLPPAAPAPSTPCPLQAMRERQENAFNLLKSCAAAFPNWELPCADSEVGHAGLGVRVTSMIDVFISYARRDRYRALALTRALKERGFSVWWDWDFFGAEDLKGAIHNAIGKASKVLVLWSAQSIGFDVVTDEALEAKKQGKLVSISIDGSAPPAEFADLATLFLPDTTTDLDEVVAAIKSRAPLRNLPPGHARLRKFGHVLTGSATALGLTMAVVTFWLNLPPPKRLGEENLGISVLAREARYQTNSGYVVTKDTLNAAQTPPEDSIAKSPASTADKQAAAPKELTKVNVRMVIGACVVSDPSGTPLDVRTEPQGTVVRTLANGRLVLIADIKSDGKGQPWVLVANSESGEKLGWVSRKLISCP